MPIQLKKLTEIDLAPVFARRPRGEENVDDYVEILESQKINVGQGLSIKTVIVTPDEGDSYTILADSADESDPAGINVRTAKRRFGIAADRLGYDLDWKEVDGWLIMKAIPLKPAKANGKK